MVRAGRGLGTGIYTILDALITKLHGLDIFMC